MKQMSCRFPWALLLVMSWGLVAATAAPSPVKVTFAVKGMTCEGCASGLQSSLARVQGIQSVKVSYEKKQAELTLNETRVPVQKAAAEIVRAGFTPVLLLSVKGMSCQACASSVKTALKKLDGVDKVTVSLRDSQAQIAFGKKGKVTVPQLIAAVKAAGFQAEVGPAKGTKNSG